jgi:hypothetical protein
MQAVYHMPTQEEEMPSTSIPLALQSTFYKVNAVIELPHPNMQLNSAASGAAQRGMPTRAADPCILHWQPNGISNKIQIVTWWPVCTKLVVPGKSVASSL